VGHQPESSVRYAVIHAATSGTRAVCGEWSQVVKLPFAVRQAGRSRTTFARRPLTICSTRSASFSTARACSSRYSDCM